MLAVCTKLTYYAEIQYSDIWFLSPYDRTLWTKRYALSAKHRLYISIKPVVRIGDIFIHQSNSISSPTGTGQSLTVSKATQSALLSSSFTEIPTFLDCLIPLNSGECPNVSRSSVRKSLLYSGIRLIMSRVACGIRNATVIRTAVITDLVGVPTTSITRALVKEKSE